MQMLFTCLSVPFVASNTLASLSSPSTNVWMETSEWTQKWPYKKDISSCEPALQTVWPQSRGFQQNENPHHWTVLSVEWFSTWESGKDFGLKNSVFYIRTVLTENNKFLCIFSFTVFIVNEYFTTVTKFRISAHHLFINDYL